MRKIHVVATFADACGGSEGRALHLYRLLAPHAEVELWTEQEPDPLLAERWPIQRLSLLAGRYPREGDVVFVGAPRFGRWVRRAELGRVTVIYNSDRPERLARRMTRLERARPRELRLVFASGRLAESVPQYAGTVQLSPIDLERFAPAARPAGEVPRVGRHSRDKRYKHGESDPALYRRLAEAGVEVHVRGGTCLAAELDGVHGVHLEPASPQAPERFLQSLDVFVYRTRTDWYEASARVLVEALACGLPVVAHRRGGYIEYVQDGVNGILFETDDEAYERILGLVGDPERRRAMGAAARRSAEELYSPEALRAIVDFYAS